MSMRERALALLDQKPSLRDAAESILHGPRDLAIYTITIGLEHLKAVVRRERRRSLRREIKPEFRSGRTTGSVVFTERAKKRVVEHAQRLFDDWQIDAHIKLGNATKEELLASARAERSSAKGHIRTAMFYEALAEPLNAGQRLRDYWESKSDVVKVKNKIWRDTAEARPMLG